MKKGTETVRDKRKRRCAKGQHCETSENGVPHSRYRIRAPEYRCVVSWPRAVADTADGNGDKGERNGEQAGEAGT